MLRNIPKVDKVLEWSDVQVLLDRYPRPVVISAVREVLGLLRGELLGGAGAESLEDNAIAARIAGTLVTMNMPGLRRVINGTGVVLHTNLGR
ncbi:MAG: L-seryl-tRNA(Sec) selenium transferase, partial [Syntrophotalea acetylenica]|nr:L-seryl-tRNA(Sec) selenium transferase [Syntrophotalea acetylenica]